MLGQRCHRCHLIANCALLLTSGSYDIRPACTSHVSCAKSTNQQLYLYKKQCSEASGVILLKGFDLWCWSPLLIAAVSRCCVQRSAFRDLCQDFIVNFWCRSMVSSAQRWFRHRSRLTRFDQISVSGEAHINDRSRVTVSPSARRRQGRCTHQMSTNLCLARSHSTWAVTFLKHDWHCQSLVFTTWAFCIAHGQHDLQTARVNANRKQEIDQWWPNFTYNLTPRCLIHNSLEDRLQHVKSNPTRNYLYLKLSFK